MSDIQTGGCPEKHHSSLILLRQSLLFTFFNSPRTVRVARPPNLVFMAVYIVRSKPAQRFVRQHLKGGLATKGWERRPGLDRSSYVEMRGCSLQSTLVQRRAQAKASEELKSIFYPSLRLLYTSIFFEAQYIHLYRLPSALPSQGSHGLLVAPAASPFGVPIVIRKGTLGMLLAASRRG